MAWGEVCRDSEGFFEARTHGASQSLSYYSVSVLRVLLVVQVSVYTVKNY